MRIYTFAEEYCKDILEAARVRRQTIDLTEFPYDELVTDNEGKQYPAINVDGVLVPINDIFTMGKDDFVREWNLPNAGEAYTNYMDNMNVLEGEEAVAKIRLTLQREVDRISSSQSIDIPDYVV